MKKISALTVLSFVLILLCPFASHAESSVSLTLKGGSANPYLLTDFKSDNARFRISVRKTDDSLVINTPPFFRIKVTEDLTLGEFKPGKLLTALSSEEVTLLSFNTKIFTEPSGLSLNPTYMGFSFEKETWGIGYSYPALLFAAVGNEKAFSAVSLEEIAFINSSSFQINWSQEKLPGLEYSFILGLNRSFKKRGLSVKASSYVKGKGNTCSDTDLSFTTVVQGEWKDFSILIGSLYSDKVIKTYTITLNSALQYTVEDTLGPEPIYGMTSQYRRLRLTSLFSYSDFELRCVHTRTNGTDNSLTSDSLYRLKYSKKDISAGVEASASRTEGFGITSVSGSLELKEAELSFSENNIRLALSCTITADNLSFKITADQDRVLTFVFKYKKP